MLVENCQSTGAHRGEYYPQKPPPAGAAESTAGVGR